VTEYERYNARRPQAGTLTEQTSNGETEPVSYFQRDQTFVDPDTAKGEGGRGKENIIRRTMYTKRTFSSFFEESSVARSKKGIAGSFSSRGDIKANLPFCLRDF